MESEPKIGFRPNLPLDHIHVAPVVAEALNNKWHSVRIADSSRWGRKYLKLHKARDGSVYIRAGRRGAAKRVIDRCDVTYLDGEPTLHEFKVAKNEYELRRDALLATSEAQA